MGANIKTTRTILLLGEDNPQSSDPRHALFCMPAGCAGHRLQSRIFGVNKSTYLSMWRTNLCNPSWAAHAARERAIDLLHWQTPWLTIIMMGSKVTDTMNRTLGLNLGVFDHRAVIAESDVEVGRPAEKGFTLLSLPHPSGRNLVWNGTAAVEQARQKLRRLVPEIDWGEADAV